MVNERSEEGPLNDPDRYRGILAPPSQTVYSDRKPDDIHLCLASGYGVAYPSAQQKRDDGSIRVSFRNGVTNWLIFAATIWPEGGGSKVEFWKGQLGLGQAKGCF